MPRRKLIAKRELPLARARGGLVLARHGHARVAAKGRDQERNDGRAQRLERRDELVEGSGARCEDRVERGGGIERCLQRHLARRIGSELAWAAPLAPRLVLRSACRDVAGGRAPGRDRRRIAVHGHGFDRGGSGLDRIRRA